MSIGALISVLTVAHVEILALLSLVVATTATLLTAAKMWLALIPTMAVATTAALMTTATTTSIRAVILVSLESPSCAMLMIIRASGGLSRWQRLAHRGFCLNLRRDRLNKDMKSQ
jgi:hypothetical protein